MLYHARTFKTDFKLKTLPLRVSVADYKFFKSKIALRDYSLVVGYKRTSTISQWITAVWFLFYYQTTLCRFIYFFFVHRPLRCDFLYLLIAFILFLPVTLKGAYRLFFQVLYKIIWRDACDYCNFLLIWCKTETLLNTCTHKWDIVVFN